MIPKEKNNKVKYTRKLTENLNDMTFITRI